MANRREQKLAVIGDAGVGKTSLVRRLTSNEFDELYVPTLGYVTSFFTPPRGNTQYVVWDMAGRGAFEGLGDRYWYGTDRAVIVVDKTTDLEQITLYEQKLNEICGAIPVTIVVNKVDLGGARAKFQNLDREKVVFISCKNNVGVQQFINGL